MEQESIKFDEFGDNNELKCDVCGMLYSEFLKTGVFGCQNCYTLFKKSTIQIIKDKIQKDYDTNSKKNDVCHEGQNQTRQCAKNQAGNNLKEKTKEIHMKIKELENLLAMYEADKNYEKIDLIKAEIKKLKELEIEKN